jgi:hypothetical protein
MSHAFEIWGIIFPNRLLINCSLVMLEKQPVPPTMTPVLPPLKPYHAARLMGWAVSDALDEWAQMHLHQRFKQGLE